MSGDGRLDPPPPLPARLAVRLARALWPLPAEPPAAISTLLVVRTDNRVGNALLTIPLVRALQRALPQGQVDLLLPQKMAPIAEGLPGLRVLKFRRGAPPLGPGSWRLALSSLARPYGHSPAALMAGWLPLGLISTEPLRDTVRRVCDEPWAPHPGYWSIAVDYQTGRRVAFGRTGAPPARLPDAVAASCAIPGFFRAVDIAGRRYVDGGLTSASNLDVLAGEGLDLVIALNPMSSLHVGDTRTLTERLALAVRQNSGRRLGSEARRVRASGTEVILIQPTARDLDAMGTNLMSRTRRNEVIETAVETTTALLRQSPLGERLAELPRGLPELVRRPPGPSRSWPGFRELAAARWDRSRSTAVAV